MARFPLLAPGFHTVAHGSLELLEPAVSLTRIHGGRSNQPEDLLAAPVFQRLNLLEHRLHDVRDGGSSLC